MSVTDIQNLKSQWIIKSVMVYDLEFDHSRRLCDGQRIVPRLPKSSVGMGFEDNLGWNEEYPILGDEWKVSAQSVGQIAATTELGRLTPLAKSVLHLDTYEVGWRLRAWSICILHMGLVSRTDRLWYTDC